VVLRSVAVGLGVVVGLVVVVASGEGLYVEDAEEVSRAGAV
jgi:hypothetical protein